MARLKLSHFKWCLAMLLFVAINVHISLFVMKTYDARLHRLQVKQELPRMASEAYSNQSKGSDHRILMDKSNLPLMASDYSDFVLGAIVEREFDTHSLFITSFMLNHFLLKPQEIGAHNIHGDYFDYWRYAMSKFEDVQYEKSGVRSASPQYFCRITNYPGTERYLVFGEFMPNRVTIDPNSNKRLDILRCKMQEIEDIMNNFDYILGNDSYIEIEILRQEQSILKYSIPWKSRKAGYMLSSPPNILSSTFNPWKGYNPVKSTVIPLLEQQQRDISSLESVIEEDANGNLRRLSTIPTTKNMQATDRIHMCVPGFRRSPSKVTMPQYLEFIQHHLLIGVSHIFLSTSFSWNSKSMAYFLEGMSSFIQDGSVSVFSQAGDHINHVNSVKGLALHHFVVKVFFVNMCLYHSKGVADYVGVWDLDEFFVPMKPYKSLLEILRDAEGPQPVAHEPGKSVVEIKRDWKGGPGWADEDGHPFCVITAMTVTMANDRSSSAPVSSEYRWVGERYRHGTESTLNKDGKEILTRKTILPTRRIFQAGLGVAGACKLDPEWSTCGDQKCFEKTSGDFSTFHKIDDMLKSADNKHLNHKDTAIIYHFMFTKEEIGASPEALKQRNEYADRFYPQVMQALAFRGLSFLKSLPVSVHTGPTKDKVWAKFEVIYENRQSVTKLSSTTTLIEDELFGVSSELPSFVSDATDLVLGSIIEREFKSWNLYLDIFLLGHKILTDLPHGYGAEHVDQRYVDLWKTVMLKFENLDYKKSGARADFPRFFCRLSNTKDSISYFVRAESIPNGLTPDGNANRRCEILRCKIEDSERAYKELVNTDIGDDAVLSVELFREEISLINFTVPWSTRRTGFMLESRASKFDAWKGYDGLSGNLPGTSGTDRLHMCVPGLENPPSQTSMPLYFEFFQHHFNLGVDHMFATAVFSWSQSNMDLFVRSFQSYIDEGRMTIASHAGDGLDNIYSLKRLSWQRDNFKVINVNMCLYLSKGVADYVAIWDLDEFFIPHRPFNSIIDVIAAMEAKNPLRPYPRDKSLSEMHANQRPEPGMADMMGHPFCYLMLNSLVVMNPKTGKDPNHPWIGKAFNHGPEPKHSSASRQMGFKKSILPTRTIFQAALHMSGACKLDPEWTPCGRGESGTVTNGNCYESPPRDSIIQLENGTYTRFQIDHYFDEAVVDEDAKLIDIDNVAVIYHLQPHRAFMTQASKEALQSENQYSTRFFPNVIKEIRARGLALLTTLPQVVLDYPPQDREKWIAYPIFFQALNQDKTPIQQLIISEVGQTPLELPAFSYDNTEFVMSSIIEREFESNNLYLTTFFLCHLMMMPDLSGYGKDGKGLSAMSVRADAVPKWSKYVKQMDSAVYSDIGVRTDAKFYCSIKNSRTSESYVVEGEFIPNRLTADTNANRRVNILRCKLQNTEAAYQENIIRKTTEEPFLFAEILREKDSLIRFNVPWRTRRTGYLMSTPEKILPETTQFDTWKGFNQNTKNDNRNPNEVKESTDRLHMCLPGLTSPPSQRALPQFLEFIQHHLLIGVDHIFLSADFPWDSIHMDRLIQAFQSYIRQDSLSIFSSVSENSSKLYNLNGIEWYQDNIKIFFINMCLYHSKGVADYVAVWDWDEFFIPMKPHTSLIDIIQSLQIKEQSSTTFLSSLFGSRDSSKRVDLADKDLHPFCYIQLQSRVLLDKVANLPIDSTRPWIGQSVLHDAESLEYQKSKQVGFKKSILPTRKIFQAGLHMSGACNLDPEWTNCPSSSSAAATRFCYTKHKKGISKEEPNHKHDFDEIVLDKDVRTMNAAHEGVIYHYFPSSRVPWQASDFALNTTNEYSSRFFPRVYEELKKRGFDLLVNFPTSRLKSDRIDMNWEIFDKVYETRHLRKGSTTISSEIGQSNGKKIEIKVEVKQGGQDVVIVQKKEMKRDYYPEYSAPIPPLATLPSFNVDESDLVLAAVIERAHASWDLFLNVIMLGHPMTAPVINNYGMQRIDPKKEIFWKRIMLKFGTIQLNEIGVRFPLKPHYCRISHSVGSRVYVVPGHFLPNRLTPDANANRRHEILRCKMEDTQQAYKDFVKTEAGKTAYVSVEILRETTSLINFTVPWRTRRTGYMLSFPDDKEYSNFDEWKGYRPGAEGLPGTYDVDFIHMVTPCLENIPSRSTLPLYIEYVQHHLLQKVDHIFLSAPYGWNSVHLDRLIQAFHPYIHEGAVTMTSQTHDGIDGVNSMFGIEWYRDNVKIHYITSRLFLGKGIAEYVAIWDLDEFFIPRLPYNNMVELVRAMEAPEPIPRQYSDMSVDEAYNRRTRERGMADGQGHPFCYLLLNSEVFVRASGKADRRWMGEKFSHGPEEKKSNTHIYLAFKKHIIPTRTIFQAGLHMSGACRMEPRWTRCGENHKDFCYSVVPWREKGPTTLRNGTVVDFRHKHNFDELVMDHDVKLIDPDREAVIFHFQPHRSYLETTNPKSLSARSEYTHRFYDEVMKRIRYHGLELLVTLPVGPVYLDMPSVFSSWIKFDQVYANRAGVVGESFGLSLTSLNILPPKTPDPSIIWQTTKPPLLSSNSSIVGLDSNSIVSLPSFSSDSSELIMSSIIERVHDSWDLYLTTFFLCHEMLKPNPRASGALKIHKDYEMQWRSIIKKFEEIKYTKYGKRDSNAKFFCRISNNIGGRSYLVEGEFVPSGLTPDDNANYRTDILRCKMEDTRQAYIDYVHTKSGRSAHVAVEIIRDDTTLVKFFVPWLTRKTGYLLEVPPGVLATEFDVWKGYHRGNEEPPGTRGGDRIHMCVPGLESVPSKADLPLYLEFVQHHLLLGVDHLFLMNTFTWNSDYMNQFLQVFHTYIKEGKVSVGSQTGDNINGAYSMKGLLWYRDNIKIFYVNMCLYLSKGVADYVAIWDLDEFFIPKKPYNTLVEVIQAMESKAKIPPHSIQATAASVKRSWRPGAGLADADGHPFCYILLSSRVIMTEKFEELLNPRDNWIGHRFKHGPVGSDTKLQRRMAFKKSILPTRTIFQAGLHMSGACKLPSEWTGCGFSHSGNCLASNPADILTKNDDFRITHKFDEVVMDKDAKMMNANTEGIVYHYMVRSNRNLDVTSAGQDALNAENEYVTRFFDNVMKELRRRGLELLVTLPDVIEPGPTEAKYWKDFLHVYNDRFNVENNYIG